MFVRLTPMVQTIRSSSKLVSYTVHGLFTVYKCQMLANKPGSRLLSTQPPNLQYHGLLPLT